MEYEILLIVLPVQVRFVSELQDGSSIRVIAVL